MHQRHAKDGLVCMSVTVDEVKQHAAALEFLKTQKATFANLLLDEDQDFWGEKFNIIGPPAVFVFNREGKRAAKFDYTDPDNQITHKDLEALVQKLLQEK